MNRISLLYYIISPVLALFYCGCTNTHNKDMKSARSDSTNNLNDLCSYEISRSYIEAKDDSIMIGGFYLGMNPEEFKTTKSLFLKENESLGGLVISKIQGYFYKNRLARIILISEEHLNWRGGEDSYICSSWTDLYESKYNTYSGSDIFYDNSKASILDKGRCLVIVSDEDLIDDLPTSWDYDLHFESIDSNPLLSKRINKLYEESELALNRTPGMSFSEKRFSRIDIIDKNLYLTTINARTKALKQKKVDRVRTELELI